MATPRKLRHSYFIPLDKRNNLSQYKYSGQDKSLLSQYVLSPYWNKLVTLFPMEMAPNAITLLGLGFVCINVISMIVYLPALSCTAKPLHKSLGGPWDPLIPPIIEHKLYQNSISFAKNLLGVAKDQLPDLGCPNRLIYFTWAIGLWFYQSLDAIDGKQARRTGTSGPLGEMFDHGCDAINTTLEVLLCSAALNIGQNWWTVASQVATLATFYLTTWEEYHTGTLYLSAFSGPVEGIILIIVLYIVTGIKGPGYWDQGLFTVLGVENSSLVQKYHIKNLPLNETFFSLSAIGLIFNIITSSRNVIKKRIADGKDPYSPLLGLLPFVLHSATNCIWLVYNPDILGKGHLVAFSFMWGLQFAYQVGLLITAHTTKQVFPFKNWMTMLSIVGALDAINSHKPNAWAFQTTDARRIAAIYIAFVVVLANYVFFVRDVINTICDYFDINCLTIKHKPGRVVGKEMKTQ